MIGLRSEDESETRAESKKQLKDQERQRVRSERLLQMIMLFLNSSHRRTSIQTSIYSPCYYQWQSSVMECEEQGEEQITASDISTPQSS